MTEFVSMYTTQDKIVDCRRLQFEFSFDNATQTQLRELAIFCVSSVKELLDNSFYLEWSLLGKRVKEAALIEKLERSTDMCDFDFHGNARASGINNHKTMIAYNRQIFDQLNTHGQGDDVSVDYWDTYTALFENITTPEDIRKRFITLFQLENRHHKQRWIGEDVTGHLFTCPYKQRKDLYFGHFDFRIALPCLGNNTCSFANKSVRFLKNITSILPDINGRVALSPSRPPSSCSSYMNYFGGWLRHCPSNKPSYMQEHEWIHACFIKGVEWFNLVSPLQSEKLRREAKPENIVVDVLPTGGCAVSLNKNILQTQISDLCDLKVFLYPILYPGGIEIPIKELFRFKPRAKWESVPILEKEVKISQGVLVVQYQSDGLKDLSNRSQ